MKYLVIIIFSVLLITIAYCIPKFFIWNILGYENWNIYSETGTIGDTFGGLSAPFIGILNVILLIWTLYQQIEFEKKQDIFNRNQISIQKIETGKKSYVTTPSDTTLKFSISVPDITSCKPAAI